MSDKQEPAGGGHPLAGLVKKAAEREEGQTSSLATYLVLIGLVVAGFAVMGFLVARARRRAAKMAFKLRKAKEEQRRALEESRLSDNAERREAAHYEACHLYEEIDKLKKEIQRNKNVTAERVKAIQEATSWKELGL